MIIDDDALDPEIRSLMEALAPYPARDPVDEVHGLENFLSGAKLVRDSSSPTIPRRSRQAAPPRRQTTPFLRSISARHGLKALAASFILLVLVFFGASQFTTQAARGALPGDTLYPVKTTLEKIRITLNTDAAQNAELHLLFAQSRLDEISLLMLENRIDNLQSTAELFRHHLLEALKAARKVAENDPARAQKIAKAANDLAAKAIVVLTHLRTQSPESALLAIDQALGTIEQSTQDEAFSGLAPIVIPSATPAPEELPLPPSPTTTTQAFSPATETPAAENTPSKTTPPTKEAPTSSPEAAASAFDIDIQSFKVSPQVRTGSGNTVQIHLDVKNNGRVEGQGIAVVSGLQNGVEVYHQSLQVSDAAGGASRRYLFPEFTPTNAGEIVWIVSLSDDDPDVDEQAKSTRVEAGDNPGSGVSGNLDLDIQNYKIPASIKLSKSGLIEIELDIKNNGLMEGQGTVIMRGVQNGVEVYSQTLTVTDAVGGRFSRYVLPGYASAAPGEIVWTITLSDGDPDTDTVMATTYVEP